MKKIIELLKSLKFWSIVAGVAAVISAIVALIPYLEPDEPPRPSVYIGKVNKKYKLKGDRKYCVNYLIPVKYKEKKSVLPFPIIIQNSERQNINDFYVEFNSEMKEIYVGDKEALMTRLYPEADFERTTPGFDPPQNKLLIENGEKKIYDEKGGIKESKQIVGNKSKRILFYNNDVYSNFLALNVADDEGKNPWDEFTLEIEVGTDATEQHFKVEIRCYFVENETSIPEEFKEKKGIKNFIVRPVYRGMKSSHGDDKGGERQYANVFEGNYEVSIF